VWKCSVNDRYNLSMSLRVATACVLLVSSLGVFVAPARAQFSTPNSAPFPGTPSSVSAACSVVKSCAEVAPDIIRKALGPSPLEQNLRHLEETKGKRPTGSDESKRTIAWAVNAFKLAGVDQVHTEKFALPRRGGSESLSDSMNVVAEIRGRDLPEEFVILAAHLDSITSGAEDVSESAAMLIDAARSIHASGSIPRRSIRFVLFTGAKNGMPGPRGYTAAHRAELDRVIAAINLDGGTGSVIGYSLGGRDDIVAAVREALAPVRSLGANQFTTDAKISVDTLDFLLEGIPTLDPNMQSPKSTRGFESSSGAYDKTAIEALKHQVAIAAVSAYALADTERRVGSRQSREQVGELLQKTGLDRQMKAANIFSDWESGNRGRQQ
jgi:acetylornithine deacetylase/succinyl-diaminopimelate desuccinylase-like protein